MSEKAARAKPLKDLQKPWRIIAKEQFNEGCVAQGFFTVLYNIALRNAFFL